MNESTLKSMVADLTDVCEKNNKLKIEYLKDSHSMFVWALTISSAALLVIFGKDVFRDQFESHEWLLLLLFFIQVLASFFHRMYNGNYIDNLIERITYLNLQKVYINNRPEILGGLISMHVLEVNTRINRLEFIKTSGLEEFPDISYKTKMSRWATGFYGVASMAAFIGNFFLMVYMILR